jgi:hypothetical protein
MTPIEKTLESFISKTEKSKIAVVIPMFGYWKESYQLDELTLKATLSRIYSHIHQIYLLFLVDEDSNRTPMRVASMMAGKYKGGNCAIIPVKKGSGYGEYLRIGIQKAIATNSQYIVVANPWIQISTNGIDILVDRINRNDAYIVSGFDCKGKIDPGAFDKQIYNLPDEFRGIDINLFGMKKTTAEIISFDEGFKTHYFIGRDAWQTVFTKGFESIITQRVPIFSFDVDWTEFESAVQFKQDENYFISKWKYGDESIQYP